MNHQKISIIIPAYNEEKRIEASLDKIVEFTDANGLDVEIIVVDDGSSDKTTEKATRPEKNIKVIKQPQNLGKGAAVRRGMIESCGDIKLFTDADLSTPIYEMKKVLERINDGIDVFVGSRAVDYSMIKKHQPMYRELMGKTFNLIVQLLVLKGIKDTQCGFKAFTANAANKIFNHAKINGFGFDVELLYLARKFGLNISEVPVEWYNDDRTTVSPIFDSAKMFWEILKVRYIHKNL
jgi:dolichyl-phosphate beta-glucosyltransferase